MPESGPSSPQALAHRVTRMTGRDPAEPHRAATPLELLFDLTFVVAYGPASSQPAPPAAAGQLRTPRGPPPPPPRGRGRSRRPRARRVRLHRVRHRLGLGQLLVVRVRLRHRRL